MEKSETSEKVFGIHEWIKTLQYLFASGFFAGVIWTYTDSDKLLHPILYYATFLLPGIGFSFAFYFILKLLPKRNFSFALFCILTNLLFLLFASLFALSSRLVEYRFYGMFDPNFVEQNIVFLNFLRFFLILSVSSFAEMKIIEYTTDIRLKFRYVFLIALIAGLSGVVVFFGTADWIRETFDFFRLKGEADREFHDWNVISIRFTCFVWTLIHGCITVVLIWAGEDEFESEFLPVNSNS
ncbi:hypothetical protein EHQ05_15800 [Leptospira yasudae]|uniref:hypothetical protein n=1 Tax=Leptospira yasudae TaxID=2202201 RepID=UPI0010838E57|nr:hypothetical protein [Leptospira yasudae]TGK24385.1 hypothetical protein EHQ05_15800 [Leptospira yasudae]TGM05827.1 hypothetical protein EHQ86_10425 [Leptospira yasudae]